MKPLTIADTLKRQGKPRPNLRSLSKEETDKLELPRWEKKRLESKQASASVLLYLIPISVGLIGIVYLAALWRRW